jgi:hypothetical protein
VHFFNSANKPERERWVANDDVGNGRGQREHHVVILDRQQVGLARIEPALGRIALALGAMSVATGVVADLVGTTPFTVMLPLTFGPSSHSPPM